MSTLHSQTSNAPSKLYDLLAGSPLIIWYGLRCIEQFPQIAAEFQTLYLSNFNFLIFTSLFTKCLGLLFAAMLIILVIVRSPASAGTQGFLPRMVAFFGAFLGIALLRLPPQPIPWIFQLISLTLMIVGISFAVYSLMWLGRSFSVMPEARKLVTGGPYALVRHPVYLGEEIAIIGLAIEYSSLTALTILLFQLGFQLYRMHFEEQVMRELFPQYIEYEARVKRLIPYIY